MPPFRLALPQYWQSGRFTVSYPALIFHDGGLNSESIGDSDTISTSLKRSRRSEEHTSELQSLAYIVCRLLLEKKKRARVGVVRTAGVTMWRRAKTDWHSAPS